MSADKQLYHRAFKVGDNKALCGADLSDAICITDTLGTTVDCPECIEAWENFKQFCEWYKEAGLL